MCLPNSLPFVVERSMQAANQPTYHSCSLAGAPVGCGGVGLSIVIRCGSAKYFDTGDGIYCTWAFSDKTSRSPLSQIV